MSNWSRVIVSWEGADRSFEDKPAIDQLVADLERQAAVYLNSVVYPCHTEHEGVQLSKDRCCEGLLIFAANHFIPTWAQTVLSRRTWEYPQCVELLWKTEDDDTYQRWTLSDGIRWGYGGEPPEGWAGETADAD